MTSWPVVNAAKKSVTQVADYLQRYYQGMTVVAGIGEAKNNGRLFYRDDFSALNFSNEPVQLDAFLNQLQADILAKKPKSRYVGSIHIDKLLPNFRTENDLAAIASKQPLASLWLSNQSCIAAHHDIPNNIACCIAGKRRFTLFPPDQLENLYIGPLDFTPAGQAISLVDFNQVDFKKFPKFKAALKHAVVAELSPGDALFIPSMWWHHVESLSKFNVLINYWWQSTSAQMGAPIDALYHAILNIKNLPSSQKSAWLEMFKFYVFNDDPTALAHIPKEKRGMLNPADDIAARQIRAMLLNKLNR